MYEDFGTLGYGDIGGTHYLDSDFGDFARANMSARGREALKKAAFASAGAPGLLVQGLVRRKQRKADPRIAKVDAHIKSLRKKRRQTRGRQAKREVSAKIELLLQKRERLVHELRAKRRAEHARQKIEARQKAERLESQGQLTAEQKAEILAMIQAQQESELQDMDAEQQQELSVEQSETDLSDLAFTNPDEEESFFQKHKMVLAAAALGAFAYMAYQKGWFENSRGISDWRGAQPRR